MSKSSSDNTATATHGGSKFYLSPFSAKPQSTEALRSLVGRVHKQRGHFRNVDIDKLEAEARAASQGVSQSTQDGEDADDVQDQDADRKEFYAKREELRKFIGYASFHIGKDGDVVADSIDRQAENEALMGLDFVSLLLSKDAPLKGEASMSPALKTMTAPGTLTYDRTPANVQTKEADVKDEKATLGWTLQSLANVADSLLASATKLQTEMQRESRYWNDVLSMKEKGFSVYRPQKNNSTLAVRYGFAEAAPQFQSQGVAPLRQDADGGVKLGGHLSKQPKALRVSIWDKDKVLSRSAVKVTSPDSSAGELVQSASDSIFEEDLFHELSREARELHEHDVQLVDQTINVPLELAEFVSGEAEGHVDQHTKELTLAIELRPLAEMQDHVEADERHQATADGIALLLRLGLANIYREKLNARSLPPAPISDDSKTTPAHAVISSMMGLLAHVRDAGLVQTYISRQVSSLKSLNIPATHTSDHKRPNLAWLSKQSKSVKGDPIKGIAKQLTPPFASSLSFEPFKNTYIKIDMKTHLALPPYGTEFKISTKSLDGSIANRTISTDHGVPILSQVLDWMTGSLVEYIVRLKLGWTSTDKARKVLYKQMKDKPDLQMALSPRIYHGQVCLSIWQPDTEKKVRYKADLSENRPIKEVLVSLEEYLETLLST